MAENGFLPFALTDTGSNLLSQQAYERDSDRFVGNQPGVARSELVNKVLRQTSLVAAGVGELIAVHADAEVAEVSDNLSPPELAALLARTVVSLGGKATGLPEGGAPGQVLMVDADGNVVWGAMPRPEAEDLFETVEITESGIFEAEAGATYFVEVLGGGGAGGGGSAGSRSVVSGGGSSGSYRTALLAFDGEEAVPVTVGAGGSSEAGSQPVSADGGSSSFGIYLTAAGGLAAPDTAGSGTEGRVGVGASPSGPGSHAGMAGILALPNNAASSGHSGAGGSSPYGTGGAAVSTVVKGANDASGYGAGGSGTGHTGGGAYAGGKGSPGLVRITRVR